jgi:hypothetical protein
MTWRQPALDLTFGYWSFQLRDDEIADLTFDGRAVLRSIRAVVRDRNWDTAALVIDETVEQPDSSLRLRVHTDGLAARLDGTVRVDCVGDTITVTMELSSRTEFATNRVGLVVLHPPQNAGAELTVRHSDGSVEATRFPREISPHQPVFDIAGLRWQADGCDIDVTFTGDVFEMEDQRNWTDASYKTYSRPLGLPFPYLLAAGETVRQSIRVATRRLSSPPQQGVSKPAHRITSLTLTPVGPFPSLALGSSTAPDPAPTPTVPLGSALLVELDLATPNWRAALHRAAASGLPLDVRLVPDAGQPTSLTAAAEALRGISLARVAAFQPEGEAAHVSDDAIVTSLRDTLERAGVRAAIVGGARSHFTELNREQHRLPGDLDGVVFSVTPLFHSMRTEQLVESIAMQRLVAEQGVRIAAGRPLHIGPVSLRPRFNNVATTPPSRPSREDLSEGYGPELLDAADDRQSAPQLAAWAIASVAALAVPGVSSLTYFEEWGPRGIRSAEGDVFPVAAALRAVDALRGGVLLSGASPDSLVWAVGATHDDHETVLVTNLDDRTRTAVVVTPGGERRVELGPLGWATID